MSTACAELLPDAARDTFLIPAGAKRRIRSPAPHAVSLAISPSRFRAGLAVARGGQDCLALAAGAAAAAAAAGRGSIGRCRDQEGIQLGLMRRVGRGRQLGGGRGRGAQRWERDALQLALAATRFWRGAAAALAPHPRLSRQSQRCLVQAANLCCDAANGSPAKGIVRNRGGRSRERLRDLGVALR